MDQRLDVLDARNSSGQDKRGDLGVAWVTAGRQDQIRTTRAGSARTKEKQAQPSKKKICGYGSRRTGPRPTLAGRVLRRSPPKSPDLRQWLLRKQENLPERYSPPAGIPNSMRRSRLAVHRRAFSHNKMRLWESRDAGDEVQ